MSRSRPYDLVLLGATGFTGRLTAEYLADRARGSEPLRWAVAGRNAAKLETLRAELTATDPGATEIGILEAQIQDPASLARLAAQTRVLATTVGPYARFGEPVVAACVEQGTDYCDITGEPEFVDLVRRGYSAAAESAGVRLVSCCGFDSIPHDLGALFTVRRLPADLPIRLEGFVLGQGTISGGTWHSAVEAMGKARKGGLGRRSGRRTPAPGERRVGSMPQKVRYEKRLSSWVAPLPTIDPQVVRRSARTLEDFGPDFRYGHYVQIGSLPKLMVGGVAMTWIFALSQLPPTRRLLLGWRKPGEGPDAETRARSRFRVSFLGEAGPRGNPSHRIVTRVSGGDPGYGETSKMLAESALSLALDRDRLPRRFGALTTAEAMGDALLDRLQAAGLRFEVIEIEGIGAEAIGAEAIGAT